MSVSHTHGGVLKAVMAWIPTSRDLSHPCCTVAQICTYQSISGALRGWVTQPFQRLPGTEPSQKSLLIFNFSEFPIPPEWKERIIWQLNNMPGVFVEHNSDFGQTDKIMHHIKLSDETPFKQRAQLIHPQDIKTVRKHIQQLLDAGVIRELESPFSSCHQLLWSKRRTAMSGCA